MKKWQYILLAISAVAIFLLVYSIHFDYHLPFHMDEWHHISEALRMGADGQYSDVLESGRLNRSSGLEIGFHFWLYCLSALFNLVSIYQFLPAIWAALTALVMFFVVYKKSENNFLLGWLAMIFFASIKSNVNLTGIWFFSPLSFSLPLILLYIYFLTEGIENNDRKSILIGLAIILLLIPIHSIAILFALPSFIIYALIYRKEIAKQAWLLYLVPIIIFIGIFFFLSTLDISWSMLGKQLVDSLQFREGWGVLEAPFDPSVFYSWIGLLLAFIGAVYILIAKDWKKYAIYLIWPAAVFFMIVIYEIFHVSYLSPYQRNLYYFALSLPLLSAFGAYALVQWLLIGLSNFHLEKRRLSLIGDIAGILIIALIFCLVFKDYFYQRPEFALYRAVSQDEVKMLQVLSKLPKSTVMAPPLLSLALYPMAHQDPVADIYFYGNRSDVEIFYAATKCGDVKQIIKKYQVQYIIAPFEARCKYTELIYNDSANLLYKVNLDIINN